MCSRILTVLQIIFVNVALCQLTVVSSKDAALKAGNTVAIVIVDRSIIRVATQHEKSIYVNVIFLILKTGLGIADFIHIGSSRTARGLHFGDSDYYVSPVTYTVTWSTAQQSCRNLFGSNATLVSIESIEEWEFLKIMLVSHGIGSTYWSSGMYDLGARVWRWSSNNLPVMADAPWDNGHPASIPNGILRILISHVNRYTASWRTIQNTQSHRFICEMYRPPTEPIICDDNDLLIVLDSSANIGSHNYKEAKFFASNLVRNVTVNDNSRIGFLIYSDTASVKVSLNNTLTSDEILNAILNAPYLGGETATHLAIDEALHQFNSFPRNSTRNLIVITDGESTNSTLTATAIEMAVAMGVRTFGVGITPSADQKELLIIANGNSDYVFSSEKCDGLELLLDPLTRQICSNN